MKLPKIIKKLVRNQKVGTKSKSCTETEKLEPTEKWAYSSSTGRLVAIPSEDQIIHAVDKNYETLRSQPTMLTSLHTIQYSKFIIAKAKLVDSKLAINMAERIRFAIRCVIAPKLDEKATDAVTGK